MRLDTEIEGWQSIFKDWQIEAINNLYEFNGFEAGKLHRSLESQISRAAVNFFLADLEELGYLSSVERTGKGGVRPFYSPTLSKEAMATHIKENLIDHIKSLGDVVE